MSETAGSPPRKRRWRRVLRGLLVAVVLYVGVVATGCMNPSLPFDVVINLAGSEQYDDLRADGDTLVVLQHGLWRSWASLWRLERALEAHGYEVLNYSYPSTQGTVEDHAATLHDRLTAHLRGRERPKRLCFVGHSMGGLVIRAYLARDDAMRPDTAVFIGTPQRGAELCDKRKGSWLFRCFMGDRAALQLSPDDPLYDRLGSLRIDRIGCIAGRIADGGNDDIEGDDDGTVAVVEASLPEQDDWIVLPVGHTTLSFSKATIRQVLSFLASGRFDHE